jgi:hypothetical protein
MSDLLAFIFLCAVGAFMIPIEQLPQTTANSARALIGTLLLLCAGFFFARAFT